MALEPNSWSIEIVLCPAVSGIGGLARFSFPRITAPMKVRVANGFLHALFNRCHPTTPLASGTLALHGREEILKLRE